MPINTALHQERRKEDDPLKESLPEPAVDIVHNIGETIEDAAKTLEELVVEGLEKVAEKILPDSPISQTKKEPVEDLLPAIHTPKELRQLTQTLEKKDKEKGLPEA